ncbi:hypothetical protein Tco_0566405 [Tanacetum coccineum]
MQTSKNTTSTRPQKLQRLRSIVDKLYDLECSILEFGTSERQCVVGKPNVENAKQQAILLALKGQVNSDEAHIHLDLHSLRMKHVEWLQSFFKYYITKKKKHC